MSGALATPINLSSNHLWNTPFPPVVTDQTLGKSMPHGWWSRLHNLNKDVSAHQFLTKLLHSSYNGGYFYSVKEILIGCSIPGVTFVHVKLILFLGIHNPRLFEGHLDNRRLCLFNMMSKIKHCLDPR